MLAKAADAVAPGGTFLLVGHDTRNLAGGYGGPKTDRVLYTPEDIVADLDGSGLAIVRAEAVSRPVETPEGERIAIDALVESFSSSSGELTLTSSRSSSVEHGHVEAGDRAVERELPELERGQRRPPVGAGERARATSARRRGRRRRARAGASGVTSGQSTGRTTQTLGGRGAQPGDEPDDRSAQLAAVVEHRERQRRARRRACPPRGGAARLAERPPAALGERLAAEACERLRRAEAGRGAADEQDARQAVATATARCRR